MLGMDTVKLQVYSAQMVSKWLTILEDPAYIPKAVHVHIEVCLVVHVLNAAVCKKYCSFTYVSCSFKLHVNFFYHLLPKLLVHNLN
jgi:hypothetical protein